MTATDKILEAVESIDVNSIDCEESVKLRLILLVNAVEALAQEIRKQRDEIEYLKTLYKHGSKKKDNDEPKSGSKPQSNDTKKKPRSSLEARLSSGSPTRQRRSRSDLTITRTEARLVSRSILPHDAVHKGWRKVTIQELILKPEIICFRLERFYSPSTAKLYEAELPAGFQGQLHFPRGKDF